MFCDALSLNYGISYFGKKKYKNYCVCLSVEECVYFQNTDFSVPEYCFDNYKKSKCRLYISTQGSACLLRDCLT
jgi:hypothetical protein